MQIANREEYPAISGKPMHSYYDSYKEKHGSIQLLSGYILIKKSGELRYSYHPRNVRRVHNV